MVRLIGKDTAVQKIDLEGDYEVQEVKCFHDAQFVNHCAAIHPGARNRFFRITVDAATGQTTVTAAKYFDEYPMHRSLGFLVTPAFTIFHAQSLENSGLFIYHNDQEKYLWAGVPVSEYSKYHLPPTYFHAYLDQEGVTQIIVRRNTQEGENDFDLVRYQSEDWGITAEGDFDNEQALNYSVAFTDSEGQQTTSQGLMDFFNPSWVPPSPTPPKPDDGGDESFLSKYWWIFLILLVLIIVAVGLYFFIRQRDSDDDDSEGYKKELAAEDDDD